MGFLDDIWTALLSDDHAEVDDALARIRQDEVATVVAAPTLVSAASTDAKCYMHESPSLCARTEAAPGQRANDDSEAVQP